MKWYACNVARYRLWQGFNNVYTEQDRKAYHSATLSSYLAEELQEYKVGCNGDHLFEVREIKRKIVTDYSEHFSKLFKDLGIYNFTFHDLMHSFFSLLQSELGIGAVVVQGMTGHSNLSMLQRYSHTGIDSKKRAIEALTKHILGINEKSLIPVVSKTGTA